MMENFLRWAREHIGFRKIVILAGILLLAAAFVQIVSLDMAFLFAGDAMAWFEVFAAVTMIAVRGHARISFETACRHMRSLMARMPPRYRRMRQIATRAARALLPPRADDEDGLAFV